MNAGNGKGKKINAINVRLCDEETVRAVESELRLQRKLAEKEKNAALLDKDGIDGDSWGKKKVNVDENNNNEATNGGGKKYVEAPASVEEENASLEQQQQQQQQQSWHRVLKLSRLLLSAGGALDKHCSIWALKVM